MLPRGGTPMAVQSQKGVPVHRDIHVTAYPSKSASAGCGTPDDP